MKILIKRYIALGILLLLLNSCSNPKKDSFATKEEVTLTPSGHIIKIPIDDNTTTDCLSMFYYKDNQTGKEYLTYLNSYKNEIQFYDLKLQKLESRIPIAKEGPDEVGKVNGFKVISKDSIYLTTNGFSIFLVNSHGRVIDRYGYKKTTNGCFPTHYMSTSRVYWPLVVINKELYIPQMLTFNDSYLPKVETSPTPNSKICLVVHKNGENEYLPMEHPLAKEVGVNTVHYSREYDGNYFIYSFFDDPYIYATKDHIIIDKYYAPSRYIDKIVQIKYKSSPSFEKYGMDHIRKCNYHNIIYDPYRKLYYRFVKLPDNCEKGDDLMRFVKYPQNFSIIILNKNLKVIGETKLPSKTYLYSDFFVSKDGLYLSINHIDNPNLNIDHLQFELIKLQYNETNNF